jgi:hypothetical protein
MIKCAQTKRDASTMSIFNYYFFFTLSGCAKTEIDKRQFMT